MGRKPAVDRLRIAFRLNKGNLGRFLGLIIDDDLSWKHHIIKVTSKISNLCGIMVRARQYLPIRTLPTLYNAIIALFIYSYTKGSLPDAFSNYFSSNNTIHKHYTRFSEKFHMKFTRTNYGRFSIKYKGPTIWNTLPDVLKNIKSLPIFRKEFKTFALNQNIDY